jgi:DNA polymerase-1
MQKETIKNHKDFAAWVFKSGKSVMSLDLEGSSLKYFDFELHGWSLCDGDMACYVDYALTNDVCLLNILRDMVSELDLCIMHNAVYDIKMLAKFDIAPKRIFCTLVGAKLLDENHMEKGYYGLKNLAKIVLKVPAEEISSWEEAQKEGIHSDIFYQYATNDAIWTFMLYLRELPAIMAQDLDYVAFDIEFPFQFILADLEQHGVLVDKETVAEFIPECLGIMFEIEVEMLCELNMAHDIVTDKEGNVDMVSPVNFNSSQQLVAVTEDILCEKVIERTKRSKKFPKGQKSCNKRTIERLRHKCKFYELLYRYRKLGTLYKNFLKKFDTFVDGDGRIRANYNLVRTGRLSCSKPNLQNLPNPKKEKLEFNHRKMFIAGAGKVFIKADWSGQELRVLAEESQDEYMISCFNENLDLHFITADRVFKLGLSRLEYTSETAEFNKAKNKFYEQRHKAKNGINFPVIYGKTVQTLAVDFNITEEEAQRWMDEFHELYPAVQEAIDQTRLELEQREYVTNMMGRRRRFPSYNTSSKWKREAMLRQAFNFKIQGYSAEMFKLAACHLREACVYYDAQLVLVIHDEIIYEVDEENAKEFEAVVKDVMENIVQLSIPILVETSIVRTYGD